MKPFTMVAALIFAIIALIHLYRLIRPFEVVIAGTVLPSWVSIAGLLIASVLAVMLWRESKA